MRGFLFVSAALAAMTPQALNAQSQPDTTKAEILNEAIVRGVRAQKNAPYAVANVDRKALQNFSGTGKELPFLFSTTPGVLSWSELDGIIDIMIAVTICISTGTIMD